MNVEIVMAWSENKPVGLWLNDQLIWETKEVITEINLSEIKISLPILAAVKFCSIFINGITVNDLVLLFREIKSECIKLENLLGGNDGN